MEKRMVMDSKKVKNFWVWFKENNNKLNPEIITNRMIDILDSKILELGDFSWEIREGKSKSNMLIISPGGDIELLDITKQIIDSSGDIPDWEFEYYKPAKDWDYVFSIDETSETKKDIDATKWEYILLKYSDQTFDIIIKADTIKLLNDTEKSIAIDIVLESILGEKKSLELIKNIDIVNDFQEKYLGKQNTITVLSSHINHSL